jgi:hypothetical protein
MGYAALWVSGRSVPPLFFILWLIWELPWQNEDFSGNQKPQKSHSTRTAPRHAHQWPKSQISDRSMSACNLGYNARFADRFHQYRGLKLQ